MANIDNESVVHTPTVVQTPAPSTELVVPEPQAGEIPKFEKKSWKRHDGVKVGTLEEALAFLDKKVKDAKEDNMQISNFSLYFYKGYPAQPEFKQKGQASHYVVSFDVSSGDDSDIDDMFWG